MTYYEVLMALFAAIGSGSIILLVRVGRTISAAIRDVPQIVPLHHEAMQAIAEVKAEVVTIAARMDIVERRAARYEITARHD